jgi:tRNA uridine 5-carboxymethylaminomethyl modification enzyme
VGREVYTKLGLLQGGRLPSSGPLTGAQLLKRSEVTMEDLMEWVNEGLQAAPGFSPAPASLKAGATLSRDETRRVETGFKYEGYLQQQERQIERMKRAEQRRIPDGFDYLKVSGLSREMKEKLTRVRPVTLGQAARIPGVTPAAVSLVNCYIEIFQRRAAEQASA